jgi:dTDP-4-dehydrorhamnose reductase
MLRLGKERDEISVVDDQRGAPTTSIELARATFEIVRKIMAGECGAPEEWAGVYHMSCGGVATWCEFAQAIFAQSKLLLGGKSPRVKPIPTSAYPTPAARPRNSVLSNAKLQKRFGVQLSGWEKALAEVIAQLSSAAQ